MLTVLAVLCPPLAVLLTAPASHAIKNTGLTLLLYVPGVLHAWAAVEQHRIRSRYAHMLRLLDEHEGLCLPRRAPKAQAA